MGRRRYRMHRNPERMRRGISLVPSLFTTVAMVAGVYALLAAVNGFHYKAGAAIIIAMVHATLFRSIGTASEIACLRRYSRRPL